MKSEINKDGQFFSGACRYNNQKSNYVANYVNLYILTNLTSLLIGNLICYLMLK